MQGYCEVWCRVTVILGRFVGISQISVILDGFMWISVDSDDDYDDDDDDDDEVDEIDDVGVDDVGDDAEDWKNETVHLTRSTLGEVGGFFYKFQIIPTGLAQAFLL